MAGEGASEGGKKPFLVILAAICTVMLTAIAWFVFQMHLKTLHPCDRLEWTSPLTQAAQECHSERLRQVAESGGTWADY